jgi:Domain of unknown function (DU1801)
MTDEKVDRLLDDLRLTNPAGYKLVQAARKSVYAAVAHATEKAMYGGFMFAAPEPFCGVFAYAEHVTIEFGKGCDLKDTHHVLEGTGKFRRHIKICALADISATHLSDYVMQEYENSSRK